MMTSRYGMLVAVSRIACVIAMMAGMWLLMPQRVYACSSAGTIRPKTITTAKKKTATTSAGALNSLMAGDGTYVYFAESSSDPSAGAVLRKVSRMRADGSGYRCLYEGDDGDFISELKLEDDRLVVSMGDDIISMKTDGSDAREIVAASSGYSRGARFAVDEGKVFYPVISDSGAWEIRSCLVDGSESSRVCSGIVGQEQTGPQIAGATSGRVLYVTGERQSSSSTYLYTVWSVPIDGGDAIEIGKTFDYRVAVHGGRVYIMYGALESMQADGKSRSKICKIPGNGYSPIYNISDDVAYVGMGTTIWRVSLPSGDPTKLGTFNGSGQMEIVDGQVYFHYGIEGAIRKVDASLEDEGYFFRP